MIFPCAERVQRWEVDISMASWLGLPSDPRDIDTNMIRANLCHGSLMDAGLKHTQYPDQALKAPHRNSCIEPVHMEIASEAIAEDHMVPACDDDKNCRHDV